VVMQGNWRWLNEELHHIGIDPAQQMDVKAEHSDRVREMQSTYDRWWRTLNSRDPAAGHEIVIGSDHENPTTLTTHDISGEVAWNHDQVLEGFSATGFWEIEVAQSGEYEFALRRYPVEAAEPILGTIPIPGKLKNFYYFDKRYTYAETHDQSKALPVSTASMKIGSFKAKKDLPKKAGASDDYEVNELGDVLAVKFTARLKAGITKLEASFSDRSGKHLTAPYFITVTRK